MTPAPGVTPPPQNLPLGVNGSETQKAFEVSRIATDESKISVHYTEVCIDLSHVFIGIQFETLCGDQSGISILINYLLITVCTYLPRSIRHRQGP